jgi:hypothetical protein
MHSARQVERVLNTFELLLQSSRLPLARVALDRQPLDMLAELFLRLGKMMDPSTQLVAQNRVSAPLRCVLDCGQAVV